MTPAGIEPATFRFVAQHDMFIYVLIFIYTTRYSRQILMKLEFSGQILGKNHIKFPGNPSRGSWVVPCLEVDNCVGTWRNKTKTTSLDCSVGGTRNPNCRMWSRSI